MIDSVKIEDFGSIESADVALAPITVLYGATASGKSSLFYAILTLRNFLLNPNQASDAFLNLGFMSLGSFDDCVFNHLNRYIQVGITESAENKISAIATLLLQLPLLWLLLTTSAIATALAFAYYFCNCHCSGLYLLLLILRHCFCNCHTVSATATALAFAYYSAIATALAFAYYFYNSATALPACDCFPWLQLLDLAAIATTLLICNTLCTLTIAFSAHNCFTYLARTSSTGSTPRAPRSASSRPSTRLEQNIGYARAVTIKGSIREPHLTADISHGRAEGSGCSP